MNEVVFVDLDHTLYEAFNSRKRHVAPYLRDFLGTKRVPWDMYFRFRNLHEIFDHFYERNLRHYWLSAELLVMLRGIYLQDSVVVDALEGLEELQRNLTIARYEYPRPGRFLIERERILSRSSTLSRIRQYIKHHGKPRSLQLIIQDFDRTENFALYPGVRSSLSRLMTVTPSVLLVTEGSPPVQRRKLSLLGLEQMLLGRVFISEEVLKNQWFLEVHSRLTKAIRSGRYLSHYRRAEMIEIDREVAAYWKMGQKEDGTLYRAALNCVRLSADNPEKQLIRASASELTRLLDRRSGLRILSIGDRVERDFLPLKKALPGCVVTFIRILRGPYTEEQSGSQARITDEYSVSSASQGLSLATGLIESTRRKRGT